MSVQTATMIMKKSVQFMRYGSTSGKLPFGMAIKFGKRTSYYISPKKFVEYTGCTVADLDATIGITTD